LVLHFKCVYFFPSPRIVFIIYSCFKMAVNFCIWNTSPESGGLSW